MSPSPSAADDNSSLDDATALVEQQLVVLFRRARAGFEQLAREVHPHLDVAAYGILHLIGHGDATTVTALAERLAVGKPTVSRQVSALEQLGLVTRQRSRTDTRAVQLRLTPEGRVRLDTARLRRQARMRELLAEWDIDEVAALGELLARFNGLPW
jgi:DNA-binding MarR family transcriptional regulator